MTSSTMRPDTDAAVPDAGGGILAPALRATTIGVIALVSLHAFEALALTTVMPTIARELDGASLYAMAFTATLASGIVSIVWSGNLADRRGPRPPLLIGLVLFVAGLITQTIGWRWVFGLALVVLVVAAVLLGRIITGLRQDVVDVPWRWRSIAASVVLAVAVLGLNAVADRLDPWGITLAVIALVVVGLTLLPLTPRGTLRAARGLPTDVALRALAFAAFSGAEVYLPRLLTERDGLSPSLAGVAL